MSCLIGGLGWTVRFGYQVGSAEKVVLDTCGAPCSRDAVAGGEKLEHEAVFVGSRRGRGKVRRSSLRQMPTGQHGGRQRFGCEDFRLICGSGVQRMRQSHVPKCADRGWYVAKGARR